MPRKAKVPPGPRPALGIHLTSLRKSKGLTQMELAELLSVHQTNIAFWERSSKPPRSDLLQPMAIALGVSVEELLSPPGGGTRAVHVHHRAPRGHVQQLFDAVAKLPRRQQRRIIDVLEALLDKVAASRHSHAA